MLNAAVFTIKVNFAPLKSNHIECFVHRYKTSLLVPDQRYVIFLSYSPLNEILGSFEFSQAR